jgi:hypothetical protein
VAVAVIKVIISQQYNSSSITTVVSMYQFINAAVEVVIVVIVLQQYRSSSSIEAVVSYQ